MNKQTKDKKIKINRSYARILWRNGILGLQVVNNYGRQFFVYADPIVTLYRNMDHYVRIKRKDNNPEKSRGYHPGEIYGIIEEYLDDQSNDPYYMLTLSFGSAEKVIKINKAGTGLLEVIEEQQYLFPKKELLCLIRSIEIMQDQKNEFKMLINNTDVMVIE